MVSIKCRTLLYAASVISWGLASGVVSAQQVSNTETSWDVICLADQVCELKNEILRDTHVAARVSVFHIRGYFLLQYTVPPGIDIQRGISISLDDGEYHPTIISNCTVYGCTGHLDLTSEHIKNMKSGNKLQISFVSPSNQDSYVITFSLSGFTEAFKKLTS